MIKYLFILLLSFNASAANYLTVTVASKHIDDDDLNEFNPGLGVNIDQYIVGFFRNSHENNSVYLGYEFERRVKYFSLALQLGMITGYTDSQLDSPSTGQWHLFALPEVIIPLNDYRMKLGFIPMGDRTLTLQFEKRF